jgi:hypothetical protein
VAFELQPIFPLAKAPIAISESEYHCLKVAKLCLLSALAVEENYEMLVTSYIDLQTAIVRKAYEGAVQFSGDWVDIARQRQDINRHVIGFLTVARQYIDHTPHNLNQMAKLARFARIPVKEWFSEQYNALLGYRVMEALRNLAQHSGSPSHGIVFPGINAIEENDNLRRRQMMSLTIVPARLPKTFKASVRNELLAKGESVDLIELLKDYLVGLATVHERVRNALGNHLVAWDQAFGNAIHRAAKEFGPAPGVTLADSERDVHETIFHDLIRRRATLANRNSAGRNAFTFYVRTA